MNGLPYYKAYPRDFIDGTAGWPFELKAAYRLVLDIIYLQGGRLPDDPRYISGLLGCSVKKWKSLRADLIERGKLCVYGEFLGNDRADKELETLGKYQDKQRENATRPNKNKGLEKPRPSHTDTDTDTEVKEEPIGSSKKSPAKPRRKPEVDLPHGWVPSIKNIEDAQKAGLSPEEIDNEADQFRDYHVSKQNRFRDWDAAWRTWVRNSIKFGRSGRMAGRPKPGYGGQRSSLASIVARRHANP